MVKKNQLNYTTKSEYEYLDECRKDTWDIQQKYFKN